jgi:hypothetical protein
MINLLSWIGNYVCMGLNPFSWVPFPFAIIIIRQKVKKSIGQKEKYIFPMGSDDCLGRVD